jgi:hypothetical protein
LRRHLTVANGQLRIAVARSEGQKKDEQAPTIKAAAVKLGVGERTVHDVRKLKGHAPEEYEKLNSGEHKSVNAAVKAAGITKSKKTTQPIDAEAREPRYNVRKTHLDDDDGVVLELAPEIEELSNKPFLEVVKEIVRLGKENQEMRKMGRPDPGRLIPVSRLSQLGRRTGTKNSRSTTSRTLTQ